MKQLSGALLAATLLLCACSSSRSNANSGTSKATNSAPAATVAQSGAAAAAPGTPPPPPSVPTPCSTAAAALPTSIAGVPVPINAAAVQSTASGLRYFDIVPGTGASPQTGKQVTVNYTGWLLNGQKFDSSKDRNQPFSFTFGVGQVIKGWDQGLATMKTGGRRLLIIPPDLAYGIRGAPGAIPPCSTLIFDVELLNAQQ